MICLGNKHSPIDPPFVFIQWINEDNEGSESALIEALQIINKSFLSHETKLSSCNHINCNFCFVYILQ